ncbi:MAG TPA: histidine kinase, partial [Mycobacteriales bacterium]|nr:histidine kinase [Mycobacteriales bacterium]
MGADSGELWMRAVPAEADRLRRGEQRAGTGAGGARERVVAAMAGGAAGQTVVRRAAQVAARLGGADLLAVHVVGSHGITDASAPVVAAQRALVESLGGTYHSVVGDDVAAAVLAFARAQNATQLVIGVGRQSRQGSGLSGPGVGATVLGGAGGIDVQVVPYDRTVAGRRLPPIGGGLSRRRRLAGFAVALVLPAALAVLSFTSHGVLDLSEVMLVLLAVVAVALI